MSGERLEVSVSFEERRGYVGHVPDLAEPVVALSLGGLRRRIEALMLPDVVQIRLVLARQGRDYIDFHCKHEQIATYWPKPSF
jgi:hypothetical protein